VGREADPVGLLRRGLPWQPGVRSAESQVPSTSTINRILRRHGLVKARPRKRPRDSYVRFERPGPMQLWGTVTAAGAAIAEYVRSTACESRQPCCSYARAPRRGRRHQGRGLGP
jgi:hypothetical protein